MLNEKALLAAWNAAIEKQFGEATSGEAWTKDDLAAAIETYHAALPEDGLVEEALDFLKEPHGPFNKKAREQILTMIQLIERLTDALDAARAKIEELKVELGQLAEHDQAVGDELNRIINEQNVPKGWRLVPEKSTVGWELAFDNLYPHMRTLGKDCIRRALAAAPEPP